MILIMFNCVLYETLLATYMDTSDFQDFIYAANQLSQWFSK